MIRLGDLLIIWFMKYLQKMGEELLKLNIYIDMKDKIRFITGVKNMDIWKRFLTATLLVKKMEEVI